MKGFRPQKGLFDEAHKLETVPMSEDYRIRLTVAFMDTSLNIRQISEVLTVLDTVGGNNA